MATVLVSGASGFLGSALSRDLQKDGHNVVRLSRTPQSGHVRWEPETGQIDRDALARVSPDVVVNLAGEPIAQRWTASARRKIRDSRVNGTTALSAAIATLEKKPSVLVNGSAMGIYGAQRGDEILDESSSPGTDFLAEQARDWERATDAASAAGVRVVLSRTGLVLGSAGGMLQKMLPPFKAGVGGRLGDGKQWMSCISLEDWVRATRFLIDTPAVNGPVNLVGPEPVRNDEFTRVLASVLRRPALFPVPRIAMQLVFGEMADNTIFASQRVVPKKLAGAGFEFRHPRLELALQAELRR
jgi:uncharacterized protein (TIGR01777 family)